MSQDDLQSNLSNGVEVKKPKLWFWVLIAVVMTAILLGVGAYLMMAAKNAEYIEQANEIELLNKQVISLQQEIDGLKNVGADEDGLTELKVLEIAENSELVKNMQNLLEEKKNYIYSGTNKPKVEIIKYGPNVSGQPSWKVNYKFDELLLLGLSINGKGEITGENNYLELLEEPEYCRNDYDCASSGCCGYGCKNILHAQPSFCDMVCPIGGVGSTPCKCIESKCSR